MDHKKFTAGILALLMTGIPSLTADCAFGAETGITANKKAAVSADDIDAKNVELGENYCFCTSYDESFGINHLTSIKIPTKSGEVLTYDDVKDNLVITDANGKTGISPSDIASYYSIYYSKAAYVSYVDDDGNTVVLAPIDALIATPGDYNLNGLTDAADSSYMLSKHTKDLVELTTEEAFPLIENEWIDNSGVLYDYSAFAGDLTEYLAGSENRNIPREERTIDILDSFCALKAATLLSAGIPPEMAFSNLDVNTKKYTFTDDEVQNSPVNPILSIEKEYDAEQKTMTATINVSGASCEFAMCSLLINYDGALTPVRNKYNKAVQVGKAAKSASITNSEVNAITNMIGYSCLWTDNYGDDGVLGTITFKLPDDYVEGTDYDVSLMRSDKTVFTNKNNDKNGQLMQEYAFSNMETYTTPAAPSPTIVYGDATCNGKVEIGDAVIIMQSVVNPDKYGVGGSDPSAMTEQGKENADCYRPGSGVTAKDALSVQKLLLDSIASLPEY